MFSLVAYPGYTLFVNDHNFYIPAIYRRLNPILFPNEHVLSFDLLANTIFDELIILLMGLLNTDIFSALFLLSAAVRFIYFYSIYKIAFYFTGDKKFSIFSILLFMSGIDINGTATPTMNPYLTPGVMGLSLNLLFLSLFFNNKKTLSTVPLGIGMLVHVLSSLPFIIFLYMDILSRSYKKRALDRQCLLLASVPVLFLAFLVLNSDLSALGPFEFIDPEWEGIIRERDPYIFVTSWPPLAFTLLFSSATIFMISRLELGGLTENTVKKRYCTALFLIPLFLLVFSFISVDILKMHLFAELRPARGLLLWKIFAALLFFHYAYEHAKKKPGDILYNFSLAGTLLPMALPLYYPATGHIDLTEAVSLPFFHTFLFLWVKRKYRLFASSEHEVLKRNHLPILIFCTSLAISMPLLLKYGEASILFPELAVTICLALLLALTIARRKEFLTEDGPGLSFYALLLVGMAISIPRFSIYPSYFNNAPLIEACAWIKENTAENAVFLTSPLSPLNTPLRLTCNRPVLITYKDGGHVVYSKDYAVEWKKRIGLTIGIHPKLEKKEDIRPEVSLIEKEYDVNYLLSGYELNSGYPLLFDNGKYYIYRLD